MNTWRILEGDCIEKMKELPAESVHCVITSPPYWALRDYGVEGQLGLEKTPEEYVQRMVEVFREVKRVIREDGTLWLNLGSSYASGDMQPNRSHDDALAYGTDGTKPQCSLETGCACSCHDDGHQVEKRSGGNAGINQQPSRSELPHGKKDRDTEPADSVSKVSDALPHDAQVSTKRASWRRDRAVCVPRARASVSPSRPNSSSCDAPKSSCNSCSNTTMFNHRFKPKDMIPIPWMVAMALRADGWYLRADIIWSKPNPMPESVTDRPTKAHEYLFLLAKSADYFFDQEAVKEPSVDKESFGGMRKRPQYIKGYPKEMGENNFHKLEGKTYPTRNIRSVWNISTHPFSGAHFATFPEKLVEPCIKAGTSEKGVCGKCGRPWVRQVERIGQTTTEKARERGYSEKRGDGGKLVTNNLDYAGGHGNNVRPSKTVGWKPSCSCNADPVPATALDPFSGSGTVGVVALKHGRNFIGIELNEKYVAMARRRVGEVSPMFSKEDA